MFCIRRYTIIGCVSNPHYIKYLIRFCVHAGKMSVFMLPYKKKP